MLTNIMKMGYGGANLNTILPKAILELQGHTITGPLAGVAANTPIPIAAGIDIQDTIQKVITLNGGTLADVTAQTTITDLRANATLTLAGVVANDKVTVNGLVFKFVAAAPFPSVTPGQVNVGASDTLSAVNLAAAITSQCLGLQATSTGAVVTVVVAQEGTAGNADAISVSQSNGHVTASGTTFAGGSAANSISISTATTGGQILMFWYKKSRVIGEI